MNQFNFNKDNEYFETSQLLYSEGVARKGFKNSLMKQKEMEFLFIPEEIRMTRIQEKSKWRLCEINYNPKAACDCQIF